MLPTAITEFRIPFSLFLLMLQSTILKLANEYAPDTIAIRHHLHANPELSYQEFETSSFIQEQLTSLDIPFQVMAGTGVIAMIEGNKSSNRVVALRADMDALPIQEENKVDYKSTRDGIMHACGHDVHTSCLLGAARILKQLESGNQRNDQIDFSAR